MYPPPEVAENSTRISPITGDSDACCTTSTESRVAENRLVTVPSYTTHGTPLLRQALQGQNANAKLTTRNTHSTATPTTATSQNKTVQHTTPQTLSTDGMAMTSISPSHCNFNFEKFHEVNYPEAAICLPIDFSTRGENGKKENDKCLPPTDCTTTYPNITPPSGGIPVTQALSMINMEQYPPTNNNAASASPVGNEDVFACRDLSAIYEELLKPVPKDHYDPRFSVTHQTRKPSDGGHSPVSIGYSTQTSSERRSVVRCPALIPSTMYQDIPPAPATIQNEVETLARNISRMYLESGTFPANFFDLLPQRESKYMVNILFFSDGSTNSVKGVGDNKLQNLQITEIAM